MTDSTQSQNQMPTAIVFDIERFAVNDGPGIRTVVFLKGCPLHCLWCHNPESQVQPPEILFSSQKCTACGRCAAACPAGAHVISKGIHLFDRSRCIHCGRCVRACLSGALELAGRSMTVDEVLAEVLRDKPFYDNSGGGLTLSGGEPLMNAPFALALLRGAKEAGLHTAVETSGAVARETLMEVAPYIDLWLWDVKHLDPACHRVLTGGELAPILANLEALNARGAEIVLRRPSIPGVNDSPDGLAALGALAERIESVSAIDIEPYHPLGVDKARRLGRSQKEYPFPPKDYVARICTEVARHTRKPVRPA